MQAAPVMHRCEPPPSSVLPSNLALRLVALKDRPLLALPNDAVAVWRAYLMPLFVVAQSRMAPGRSCSSDKALKAPPAAVVWGCLSPPPPPKNTYWSIERAVTAVTAPHAHRGWRVRCHVSIAAASGPHTCQQPQNYPGHPRACLQLHNNHHSQSKQHAHRCERTRIHRASS